MAATAQAKPKTSKTEFSKETYLFWFESMLLMRKFEEKAGQLYGMQKIRGFCHLYIGQEACAAGAVSALTKGDKYITAYRDHAHPLALGTSANAVMAELFGKETGVSRGKGGSMHIADLSIGVLGANGEVAGGLPIAVGAGMAIKLQKKDSVVITFFGDGASNRGAFHEALNWAAIYKLPVIFLNENNHFASTERTSETTSVTDIANRATGYRIPGISIDGNDVIGVYETVKSAVERARKGEGPTLIEAKTYRIKGHFVGDPCAYRKEEEVKEFWAKEPIGRFEKALFEKGMLNEEEKNMMFNKAKEEVDKAVEFAENSEFPAPEDALSDLFANDTGYDYI